MSSTKAPIVTVKSSAIEALHNRCTNGFTEHLRVGSEIAPPQELRGHWKRRALQEQIAFSLWPKGRIQWGFRPIMKTRGPLVPAKLRNNVWPPEYLIWVGWRELWVRISQDDFEFQEAAFTFYCGRESYEPLENQLFRAEWPQGGLASERAAQPHWQVDWPLANLTDFVSGIHFGMAGWNCNPALQKSGHISGHWQRNFGGQMDELETWAIRTLEYSLDQIAAFYRPELT